jgi:hypothetical protein
MNTYSDEQLADAVAESRSWRGVLRSLGLREASAGAARTARKRTEVLGIDVRHFTGQGRWSDEDLAVAVAESKPWAQVANRLGLAGGSSTVTIRGHAARLAFDAAHISAGARPKASDVAPKPREEFLPRAGAMLAAAWYELCGISVSWPLEPRPFDLVAWSELAPRRVQVKTTRSQVGSSWRVKLSSQTRTGGTYDPTAIDDLFVIDARGRHFLIPFERVAGLHAIHLSAYEAFRVRTPWD